MAIYGILSFSILTLVLCLYSFSFLFCLYLHSLAFSSFSSLHPSPLLSVLTTLKLISRFFSCQATSYHLIPCIDQLPWRLFGQRISTRIAFRNRACIGCLGVRCQVPTCTTAGVSQARVPPSIRTAAGSLHFSHQEVGSLTVFVN